jgi:hypothetical protein
MPTKANQQTCGRHHTVPPVVVAFSATLDRHRSSAAQKISPSPGVGGSIPRGWGFAISGRKSLVAQAKIWSIANIMLHFVDRGLARADRLETSRFCLLDTLDCYP